MADITFEALSKLKQEVDFSTKGFGDVKKAYNEYLSLQERFKRNQDALSKISIGQQLWKDFSEYGGDIDLWLEDLQKRIPQAIANIGQSKKIADPLEQIKEKYNQFSSKDKIKFFKRYLTETFDNLSPKDIAPLSADITNQLLSIQDARQSMAEMGEWFDEVTKLSGLGFEFDVDNLDTLIERLEEIKYEAETMPEKFLPAEPIGDETNGMTGGLFDIYLRVLEMRELAEKSVDLNINVDKALEQVLQLNNLIKNTQETAEKETQTNINTEKTKNDIKQVSEGLRELKQLYKETADNFAKMSQKERDDYALRDAILAKAKRNLYDNDANSKKLLDSFALRGIIEGSLQKYSDDQRLSEIDEEAQNTFQRVENLRAILKSIEEWQGVSWDSSEKSFEHFKQQLLAYRVDGEVVNEKELTKLNDGSFIDKLGKEAIRIIDNIDYRLSDLGDTWDELYRKMQRKVNLVELSDEYAVGKTQKEEEEQQKRIALYQRQIAQDEITQQQEIARIKRLIDNEEQRKYAEYVNAHEQESSLLEKQYQLGYEEYVKTHEKESSLLEKQYQQGYDEYVKMHEKEADILNKQYEQEYEDYKSLHEKESEILNKQYEDGYKQYVSQHEKELALLNKQYEDYKKEQENYKKQQEEMAVKNSVTRANSIGNLDFNSLITNGEAWGLPQLSDPMIAVIQAIQKLATQAVDVFKHMVDKSFELKKKYVDVFSSLALEIGGPIGDIVSEFAPIVKSMLDIGQSVADLGFDQLSSLIQGKAGLFSFIEGIVDIKHNIKELQLDIYQTFAKIGIKAIKTFAGAISKLSGFDGLKNLFKSIKGLFSNIVRRVGYQSIRRVISKVFKDIQTQIQSLAKTSSTFNTQISNILQKLYQLGASIVGLFAPILSAIYPVVIKIIDYCNAIVEAVGKVISALTGKSYFKAIVSGYDYAAEAAGNAADEQERFLADWDTLNKLPDPNKSSSGSSSGNSLSDLVTWEEVLPSENEWATAIKNMFNGEGESLGSLIAAEINKAVDTLDKFWEDNDVKTKLNKFATGLATTINTAIQNTDWSQLGTSIGTKLGDVVDSITNFWQTIDTEEVAQAIADFFNSLNETNLINKLATMIYTIGKVILDVIVKAIEKIDWEEAGKKLAEALNKIASLADDIDWTKVVEAIKTLGTSLMQELETGPLGAFFEQIGYVIENFIELMQDIAEGDLIGAAWNATLLGAAVGDLKDMSEEYCNLMSTFPDITSAEAGALSDLNLKYIATQGSLKGTKAWAKKWIDQNPEMVKSLLDDKEALKEYLKEMGFSETEAKRITKTISDCWEEYGGVVETETDAIIEDIEGVSTETATKSKAAADSFDKNFVLSSIWSDTDTKLSDVATSMAATMSSDNIFTLALDWLTSLISGLGNKQKNDEIKTKGTNISTGLLSSIKTALGWNSSSGIFTNIYNIGVNILKGLSSGLDNKTENNNISTKATKIGAKAVGGVSKGAQEGSPSKATRRTGKYILQGLIIGLLDSALNKQLESTSYDVGADSINTLNEGLNKELGLGVDKLSSKGIQISYAGGNDALISSIYSIAENTSNINRIIEKCVADATVLPAVSVAQLTTAIHNQTQMEQSYYEAILSAISYSSSNIQQAINKSNLITQQSALQIDGMAIVNAINKISSQQSKSPLIIV